MKRGRKPAEEARLREDALRKKNWKRWGPYLSERQWGTVREDYSPDGNPWEYFPHDHARSRAYRWGEDGLLGVADREGRLCFGLALWNGKDPILKERLFGLTGPEGNHGEDVKEAYFYLDSTPTHSYMKALNKYPQAEFPYRLLSEENRRRGKEEPEFELQDTGVFEENRYFDVFAEYAKASPDDLLIRITVANRGPEPAPLSLLPTLWFRNTWSWGRTGEGYWPRPSIVREYPWFAAWDLAFHMIPFAEVDPEFAKAQILLFLREWYMHPNGQIPAYEFAFSDVNPPVHAWAAWQVYKRTGPPGKRDRVFLARVFQKLMLNFTWWVNRKDVHGDNVFSGGFLGLDNIGVFDRSQALPTGGHLEQADGTAWMAFFCSTMLSMALELAREDPVYDDVASKFFEHFIAIADAMNTLGETGLWDEEDGFYYDHLHVDGQFLPLKLRSLVGLIPLIAAEAIEDEVTERLPGFRKRMNWFMENRKDLARQILCGGEGNRGNGHGHCLLAIPTKERLVRILRYLLDENEFLSPHGIRSLSRVYRDDPYVFRLGSGEYRVEYVPGESTTGLFGGNSNWRGPIWFPVNYLLIEALERYHHFYGDSLQVECPTGSGRRMNLGEVATELSRRLAGIFLPDGENRRPCHGGDTRYAEDPHWRDLVLFHEYFHGETGRGIGASHQTGWTALVVNFMKKRGSEGG